jgi:hypothetical protein
VWLTVVIIFDDQPYTGIFMVKVIYSERYIKANRGIPFNLIAKMKEIASFEKIEQHLFKPPPLANGAVIEYTTGVNHWDKLLSYLMSTTDHHVDMTYGDIRWRSSSLPAILEGVSGAGKASLVNAKVSRIARWLQISRGDSAMVAIVVPHFYKDYGVDHRFVLYSNDEAFHPIVALMMDYFISNADPPEPFFS